MHTSTHIHIHWQVHNVRLTHRIPVYISHSLSHTHTYTFKHTYKRSHSVRSIWTLRARSPFAFNCEMLCALYLWLCFADRRKCILCSSLKELVYSANNRFLFSPLCCIYLEIAFNVIYTYTDMQTDTCIADNAQTFKNTRPIVESFKNTNHKRSLNNII